MATLTPEQIRQIAEAKAKLAAQNTQNKTDISNNVGLQNSAFTPQVAAPAPQVATQTQNNAGLINTAYDSYLQSQLAGIQGARDQANSDYQSQIDKAPETYAPQRQKVDTATARNVQNLNMTAAAKGTAFEGGVASDQSQIRNTGEQQKTALTQQEINFVQNLKKAIADNTKAASYQEVAATGQATMAKNQALMNENIRVDDTNYNRNMATQTFNANQQATNFTQNMALKNFALDQKQIESQLKTASLTQAGQMISNEMNEISLAIQKDPNSPENQARAISLQKAKVELQDALTNSKYTEQEAKARVGALLANIRQSDASATNSIASADATKREIQLKEDAAKVVADGRIPTTADIKNTVDAIRATSSSENSQTSAGPGGESVTKKTTVDPTKAINSLQGLVDAKWPMSYIVEVAAQLGIIIPPDAFEPDTTQGALVGNTKGMTR